MAQQRHKGFTLMELMITVAIIAILAALALPSFQSILEKQRLVGAANTLFANLQYARSEAIKQNQAIRFQFNTASWCFGVDDTAADCDCTNVSTCTINTMQKVVSNADYTNVTFAVAGFAGTTIDFDPRQGLPSDSGTFTFSINGQSKAVVLNPVGRVRVN